MTNVVSLWITLTVKSSERSSGVSKGSSAALNFDAPDTRLL